MCKYFLLQLLQFSDFILNLPYEAAKLLLYYLSLLHGQLFVG